MNGTSADRRLQQGCEGASNYRRRHPKASACKDTSKKRSAEASRLGFPSVGYWSKEINRTLTGGRKKLSRDIDGPARGAASMESCRFAARRSLGGRFWSVVDVRNRLRRMRGRFHRWIHISTGPQPDIGLEHKSDNFSIQSSLWSTKHRRMRSRGHPTPDLSRSESEGRSTSEKSK